MNPRKALGFWQFSARLVPQPLWGFACSRALGDAGHRGVPSGCSPHLRLDCSLPLWRGSK